MSTLVRLRERLSDEAVNITVMSFESKFSHTKWYLIPTCLTLRRPSTSSVQDIDLNLFWSTWVGSVSMTFSSFKTIRNNFTSRIACERALNAASALDYAVQDWSFEVQIMGPPIIVTRNPDLERHFDTSLAQSSFVQHSTSTSSGLRTGSNIP